MAVRSDRLASDTAVAAINTNETLATVPSTETWILKEIRLRNTGASTTVIRIRLAAFITLIEVSLAAGGSYREDVWTVLEPNAVLDWRSTVTTDVQVYLSGARLVGAAP